LLLAGAALALLGPGLLGAAAFAWHRHHLRAAQDTLGRYDLDGAQHHLDRCLAVWPTADVYFLAARTARRRDAYPEAQDHLTACRKLQYRPDALALEEVLRGVQQGDIDGVEESVRALVQQDHPDTPVILEALARGYAKTFRLEQAIDSLSLLLQREPGHVPALLLRAKCLGLLGQDEDAAADYEKAVGIAPDRDEARLALARTLWRLGRVREAAGEYECLRRRQPDDPDVLAGLALCRQDLAQLDEAVAVLDDLLARHPDSVPGLVERGRVAFRSGDAAAGERWARQAVERAPYGPDAALVLGLCLEAQGRTHEAGESRERGRELEAAAAGVTRVTRQLSDAPRDAALHCRLGVLLLRLGRDEAGENRLLAALKYDPGYRPAHQALAEYYERTRQPALAARHRQAADGRP
jgi:tetratricopeptide (TPR) repeat protein